MATYKLMQDIEAEDHILGPLTLRQFIYALVAITLYYIGFVLAKSGGAFLLVIILPPALFFSFFAFPFGKDQSTEVWALAKLRFFLKPRRRIWDQSGVKELVEITAPKRVEIVRTDGLSQLEVKSRLSALANTLDSRGWAVKNVNVNAFAQPDPFMAQASDRLIDANSFTQEVPDYEVKASDDILDESSNPVAQQFTQMISTAEKEHREKLVAQMNGQQPAGPANNGGPSSYWFMNQPSSGPAPSGSPKNDDEDKLSKSLLAKHPNNIENTHLRTLKPYDPSAAKPLTGAAKKPPTAVTPPTDPAIIGLARRDDLNISTLGREAKRAKPGDDEVVVSLH